MDADDCFARCSHTPKDEGPSSSQHVHITDGAAQRTVAESKHMPPFMRRGSWQLGDFELTSELYRGKASAVFLALDKLSRTEVVLKMYRKRKLSALNRRQVEREIRIHTSLHHPNIIPLYAAFEDSRLVCLVLERAQRGDLFERLRTGGQLSEEQAVELVVAPLLRALAHLHKHSIVHRDIKPENILVSAGDVVRLADFGMAIDMSQERPVTRVGTLDYLAPEVLSCPDKASPDDNKDNHNLAYDTKVDVWAVGVLAYETLVGYPPFEHESRTETYGNIMFSDPVFPATMTPEAVSFIRCSLSKNPLSRPLVLDLVHHPWIQQYSSPVVSPAMGPNSLRAHSVPLLDFNLLDFNMHLASSAGASAAPADPLGFGQLGSPCAQARVLHLSPRAAAADADTIGQLVVRANSCVSTPQQAAPLSSKKRSLFSGSPDALASQGPGQSLFLGYPGAPALHFTEPRAAGDDLSVAASGLSWTAGHLQAARFAPSAAAAGDRAACSAFTSEPVSARAASFSSGCSTPTHSTPRALDYAAAYRQQDSIRLLRPIKPTRSPRTGSPAPTHPQHRPASSQTCISQSRLGRTGAASWSGAPPLPQAPHSVRPMPFSLSNVLLSGGGPPSGADAPATPPHGECADPPRLNFNLAALSLHEGAANGGVQAGPFGALDLSRAHSFSVVRPFGFGPAAEETGAELFAKRLRSGAGDACIGSPATSMHGGLDDQLSGVQGQASPEAMETALPCPCSPGLRRLYSAPR